MLIKDLAQGTIDDLGSVDRQLRGYEMAREDEEIVRRTWNLAIRSFVQHEERLRSHTTKLPLSRTLEVHLPQDGRRKTFDCEARGLVWRTFEFQWFRMYTGSYAIKYGVQMAFKQSEPEPV